MILLFLSFFRWVIVSPAGSRYVAFSTSHINYCAPHKAALSEVVASVLLKLSSSPDGTRGVCVEILLPEL